MNDGGPHDQLILGDCALVLKTLPDNSVDAIITDPPYALTSGSSDKGFMGATWDNGKVAFSPDFWREALRVLRPGGHLVAFGGTRTVHRLACAIEDAGAEIRDTMFLLYCHGQGFPKSHNISAAIDRMAGAEREVIGTWKPTGTAKPKRGGGGHAAAQTTAALIDYERDDAVLPITVPATDEAKRWDGWGSSLKPAVEPVLCARKPLKAVPSDTDHTAMADVLMEVLLWCLAPAKFAEESFGLSQIVLDEGLSVSVRWIAVAWHMLSSRDPSEMMAMFKSQEEARTFWSIGRLWRSIWDALLAQESRSTTETGSGLTTALKTLNSLILAITPESIIQDANKTGGLWLPVSPAEGTLSASAFGLMPTPKLSAAEDALPHITAAIQNTLAIIAEQLSLPPLPTSDSFAPKHAPIGDRCAAEKARPAVEPILLARKTLAESTIAGNVLAWGTGGLNIDACRVEGAYGWRASDSKDFNASSFSSGSFGDGPNNLGRWPANLLLSHHESCVRVGTSTMRANGSVSGDEPSAPTLHVYGEAERKPFVAHGNGDGTETVERWRCAEGCPVAELDRQSGTSKTPASVTRGGQKEWEQRSWRAGPPRRHALFWRRRRGKSLL